MMLIIINDANINCIIPKLSKKGLTYNAVNLNAEIIDVI
jgi:hypothetical protein